MNFSNYKNQIVNQQNKSQNNLQQSMGKIPQNINRYSHENYIQNSRYGFNTEGDLSDPSFHQDEYHKYDPHYDFLQKNGLLRENVKTRVNDMYLNIDSSARNVEPKVTKDNDHNLSENPFTYGQVSTYVGLNNSKQNVIIINYPNHKLNKGDRITLSGLTTENLAINSTYYDMSSVQQNAIIFTLNSRSVVFLCNYDEGLTLSPMSFIPNFSIGTSILHTTLQNYDTSDMNVKTSGFDVNQNDAPYIGNIPINFLNSTHRVYFTNPNYTIQNGIKIYSPDTIINVPVNGVVDKITGFYILLDTPFIGTQPTNNMTVNLKFNYIGGIPINNINAEYPIDQNNLYGYHKIYSTTKNTISIAINKSAYYLTSTGSQISFGGNDIYIANIINFISGYSTPSKYKIAIPKINNVIAMKLISHNFPNTSLAFYNTNNKLYWQNQNDDDYIYNIEIDQGNYDAIALKTTLENKINNTLRQYVPTPSTSTYYTGKNNMLVTINIDTNIVTFESYTEAILHKPIQSVDPPIPSTGNIGPTFTLTIFHELHNLQVGDTVKFKNMISTFGISADLLNTTHIVNTVPTLNTYTIVLSNINISDTRTDTGGGYAGSAFVPNKFRLLFNYSDAMGKQLGFRNVGNCGSVTKYNTIVKNSDPYQNEIIKIDDEITYVDDDSGNIEILTSNAINLKGCDYILMHIKEFSNATNISGTKNMNLFFAKINLSCTIFNDCQISKLLYDPISLSELTVSFYECDKETLFNFYGLEHSYILQITYLDYLPEESGTVSSDMVC